jgi:hypothetical protein
MVTSWIAVACHAAPALPPGGIAADGFAGTWLYTPSGAPKALAWYEAGAGVRPTP